MMLTRDGWITLAISSAVCIALPWWLGSSVLMWIGGFAFAALWTLVAVVAVIARIISDE